MKPHHSCILGRPDRVVIRLLVDIVETLMYLYVRRPRSTVLLRMMRRSSGV